MLNPGMILSNRYEIIELIGTGGMSEAIVIVFEFVLLSLSSFLPQPERAPATNTPVNVSANNFLNVFFMEDSSLSLFFLFYFHFYISDARCALS